MLAVASGAASEEELRVSGADLVLSGLGDTLHAYKFITGEDVDACGVHLDTPEDL